MFLAVPVSRTVERMELPSTRQPMIRARCSVLSRLTILTIGGLHFSGAGFSQAQDAAVKRDPAAHILRLLRLNGEPR